MRLWRLSKGELVAVNPLRILAISGVGFANSCRACSTLCWGRVGSQEGESQRKITEPARFKIGILFIPVIHRAKDCGLRSRV